MIWSKIKNKTGFTLMEMLLSLFIVSLISTLLLVNYRGGQEQKAVLSQAETLVNELRAAQNSALHGRETGGQVPYGYGLYFNTATSDSSYIIFADTNDNKTYDGGEATETIALSERIYLQSTAPDPVSVFFQPPFAVFYVNGVSSVAQSATINFRSARSGFTQTVLINNLGHGIYIQ